MVSKSMYRFIHIPKNGGSAVTAWLIQNQIDFLVGKLGKGVGKHKKAVFWKDEPSNKFCVVRHPYTRTVSYYNYIAGIESWTSFEDFVRNKQDPAVFKIPTPWQLQSEWILNDQDQVICEKIFHYETLESDLQAYFDCAVPLARVNQTVTHPISTTDLTDELKQIIYKHHRKDFERFGYAP